ncbi:APC family permease, partial [Catellatospora sp. NPDC049609]|uniref:APC family permease n=1 Tax=Catellatospora sp. NPDC049609 TaxID=3155505 RepID=UPI0034144AC6
MARDLAPRRVGDGSMFAFAVAASSPLTVLVGGMVATFAATGIVGVPLSFLVLGAVLWLPAVGYAAMSRRVGSAAPFYAVMARGLGPASGVTAGTVALVAYNCIQVSLYGLLGHTASGLVGGPWWGWSLLMWAVVAVLGLAHVELNAKVLLAALAVEVVLILLFDVVAIASPAGGSLDTGPLFDPATLLVDGVGGVFALGIAAFVGFETAPIYAEEARSERAAGRATLAAVVFLGGFYAVTALGLTAAVGPAAVVDAARAGLLPMGVIQQRFGGLFADLTTALLVLSMFAAALSFHHSIARYTYAMARENVLPGRLARTSGGVRGGTPVGGSVVQSVGAFAVIVGFAAAGVDPFTGLFVWLSTIGALGVLTLVVATTVAVLAFYRTEPAAPEPLWTRTVSPLLGLLAGGAVLVVVVVNTGAVLGTAPGSALAAVPALVIPAAAAPGWGGGPGLNGRSKLVTSRTNLFIAGCRVR